MELFAALLTALVFTPGRNEKLRLLERYFETAPDPDRGWALAALSGALRLPALRPAAVRGLVETRVDPTLFRLSYDYVGDLAETVALIWPAPSTPRGAAPSLDEVVAAFSEAGRARAPGVLSGLLDRLPSDERFALIKLATGGLRVGVSARLARAALSAYAERRGVAADSAALEELWHGLEPPYEALFAWLSGAAAAPEIDRAPAFRPMMLAHPVDAALFSPDELKENLENDAARLERMAARLVPAEFAAEWKWDGVRVQAVALGGARRLYTRTGEEIGGAFPDVIEAMEFEGVLDGELLVLRDGAAAPFSELQKRLGRKTVSRKLLIDAPAHLRAYDLLHDGARDLRPEPLEARRAALAAWMARWAPARVDMSEEIAFEDWPALAEIRAGARAASQEGVMLKRRDSAYASGRIMGRWFKWKRDPLLADCVLMYAQRGHGKRSSYYSDYTFGAWRDGAEGPELTPVGKAYSGYTDAELMKLDRWIRANTTDRFGPVRAVKPQVVFEVAFDAVQPSSRHKSGVAMRFPRIKRIRWDKPPQEADTLAALEALIG